MSVKASAVVSVIVPVWNAQNYLKTCVDSILKQSYPHIELVLVDDGSSDQSGEICDRYAEQFPSVKAIHKKNGGVSSARNAGIKSASGDYLMFVDSDDSISENCVRLLMETAVAAGAEYAKACFIYGGRSAGTPDDTIDLRDEKQFLPFLRNVFNSCGTLYRRSILTEYGVLFDESLKCSEDAVFIRQYLRYCNKAVTLSDAYYYYCTDNSQSISKRFYPDYACYHRKKLDALANLLKELQYPPQTSDSFLCERAYWGLRNTIIHGKKHQLSHDEFYDYMERSVAALYPYLTIEAPICNPSINSWRRFYYRYVCAKRIRALCRYASIESAYHSLIQHLKVPVKKILRRSGMVLLVTPWVGA